MKTLLFALVVGLIGCATVPPIKPPRRDCGTFDTARLRRDLETPVRTDRTWHETLIKRLSWHVDCLQESKQP